MLAAILVCFVVVVHGGDVGSDAPGIENDSSVSLLQTRAEMMNDDDYYGADYYYWAHSPDDSCGSFSEGRRPSDYGRYSHWGTAWGCPSGWSLDAHDHDCCEKCSSGSRVVAVRRRYAKSDLRCPTGMRPQSYSSGASCCVGCATTTCFDIKEKPECKSNGGCSNLNCKWSKGVCHDKSELPQKKCKASCDKSAKPWKKKCKNSKCAACPECAPPTPAPTPALAATEEEGDDEEEEEEEDSVSLLQTRADMVQDDEHNVGDEEDDEEDDHDDEDDSSTSGKCNKVKCYEWVKHNCRWGACDESWKVKCHKKKCRGCDECNDGDPNRCLTGGTCKAVKTCSRGNGPHRRRIPNCHGKGRTDD